VRIENGLEGTDFDAAFTLLYGMFQLPKMYVLNSTSKCNT